MSGFLQRLLDRAAAADAVPAVTAAGRVAAPMAEADQRLMAPEIGPADIPLAAWFTGAPEAPAGDLFDQPPMAARSFRPPPPVPVAPAPAQRPGVPRADRPEPAGPAVLFPRIDVPTPPGPAGVSPPGIFPPPFQLTAPRQRPAPSVPERLEERPVEATIAPSVPPHIESPPGPSVVAELTQGAAAPTARPARPARSAAVAAGEQSVPAVRENSRRAAAPEPAVIAFERETTVDGDDYTPTPAPVPIAEPRPPRPAPRRSPEPDLQSQLNLPEPAGPEQRAHERTAAQNREVLDIATREPVPANAGPVPVTQPSGPVTAASASVIGPLPDYQRAPMIRGHRRR